MNLIQASLFRTTVRLIMGHCSLNKYLHTIKRSNCPRCEIAEETVAHFLGKCLATSQLRRNMFYDFYLSIHDIFDNHNIMTIINYTNSTNRFTKPEDLNQTGVT